MTFLFEIVNGNDWLEFRGKAKILQFDWLNNEITRDVHSFGSSDKRVIRRRMPLKRQKNYCVLK